MTDPKDARPDEPAAAPASETVPVRPDEPEEVREDVAADEPGDAEPASDEEAGGEPVDEAADEPGGEAGTESVDEAGDEPVDEAPDEPVDEPHHHGRHEAADEPDDEPDGAPVVPAVAGAGTAAEEPDGEGDGVSGDDGPDAPAAVAVPAPRRSGAVPEGSGRQRLLRAARPRLTRAQLLAALLCAVLGFALVVQLKQTRSAGLDTLRQNDLVGILDNVTAQTSQLEAEAQRLQQQRDSLRSGGDAGAAAQEAATQRLQVLKVLAGTVAVTGPGIQVRIDDPQRKVAAATLLDAVEELRDAGAEAIQVGDVRVVVDTAFTDAPDQGGIQVGKEVVRPPYVLSVIGDPDGLSTALNIPGGVVEVLKSQGATGTITKQDTLEVSALHRLEPPQYARPAPAATP